MLCKQTTHCHKLFTRLITTMNNSQFKSRHRKFSRDFTRKRVLGFVDLLVIQLRRVVLSLSVELEKFLSFLGDPGSFSKQAFSQARQNLLHTAFLELHEQFVTDYYGAGHHPKLYKGKYQLLAVDGSLLQLPESPTLAHHFGRWKNKSPHLMVMGRLSIIYDVLNRMVLKGQLDANQYGERVQFFQLYQSIEQAGLLSQYPSLFLMDRGYPSFEVCKRLDVNKQFFVIRCRADFCKEVKEFVAEDVDEKLLYLSPKPWQLCGTYYPSAYQEDLQLRVVRILLPSGEYEYLLTNTDFDADTLSELYQLRWGAETFYGFLKQTLQLENFSAKTKEGVLQDCYASLLTANLAQLLIEEAEEEMQQEQAGKNNKYRYQINKNVAMGILRDQIPPLFSQLENLASKLELLRKKIKRYKIPIVPGRNFPRKKARRTRRKYHLAKKRAF